MIITKCIEEKATYHGRRHDTVMYRNRGVKCRDLLAIANHYHRMDRFAKQLQYGTGHIPGTYDHCRLEITKAEDGSALQSHQKPRIKIMKQLIDSVPMSRTSMLIGADCPSGVQCTGRSGHGLQRCTCRPRLRALFLAPPLFVPATCRSCNSPSGRHNQCSGVRE